VEVFRPNGDATQGYDRRVDDVDDDVVDGGMNAIEEHEAVEGDNEDGAEGDGEEDERDATMGEGEEQLTSQPYCRRPAGR